MTKMRPVDYSGSQDSDLGRSANSKPTVGIHCSYNVFAYNLASAANFRIDKPDRVGKMLS